MCNFLSGDDDDGGGGNAKCHSATRHADLVPRYL